MRAVLVAGSPVDTFEKLYNPKDNDLIIGIDGGIDKIKNYSVDRAYGDFDSLEKKELLKTIPNIKIYPVKKDETDLELAIDSIKQEVDEILIFNATGGRLDHFLANLKLIERFKELKITIVDEQNEISILTPNKYFLNKTTYKYFSLIPIEESIVSINGALYNIEKKQVLKDDTFTVSNQVIEKTSIELHKGLMYLILSKDA